MPFWTPVLGGIQKGRAHLLPRALAMKAQRPRCGKTSHPRCLHRYNRGERTWLTRSIGFLGFPSRCALATHILRMRRRIRRLQAFEPHLK